jgi:hypothetical protein
MCCIRRLPPQRGLLSKFLSFSSCGVLIMRFFYAILIFGSNMFDDTGLVHG